MEDLLRSFKRNKRCPGCEASGGVGLLCLDDDEWFCQTCRNRWSGRSGFLRPVSGD